MTVAAFGYEVAHDGLDTAAPPPRKQIDNQYYQRDGQKNVDQIASEAESEPQGPHDQQNNQYRPQHESPHTLKENERTSPGEYTESVWSVNDTAGGGRNLDNAGGVGHDASRVKRVGESGRGMIADPTFRQAALAMCFAKGLGVIPDPAGDWFSYRALSAILGYQVRSIQTRFSAARMNAVELPEHFVGKFYRLDDAVKAMVAFRDTQSPRMRTVG